MKFQEWFDKKLVVNRFPTPEEIKKSDFDYIINVSDEFISGCMVAAMSSHKKYFWFPMNECTSDMGINSIYGALQILYLAESENAKVLLHCHAGANRSPTVAEAYHYMRSKEHRKKKKISEIKINFIDPPKIVTGKAENNRLLNNTEYGHLPAIKKLEAFLQLCQAEFDKDEAHKGGSLDGCKIKSEIQ